MLVLSRRHGERITIGEGPDQVVITVVQIRGDRVRFGISAPPDVPIHREEIWDIIHPDRPLRPRNEDRP